jgi:nucleotide-binding universal stress UspA family protein
VKTIICGIDGSPSARAALRVAAGLAEGLGARLVAIHVLDSEPTIREVRDDYSSSTQPSPRDRG